MAANQLYGLDHFGCGTHTSEGVTTLWQGLQWSAVTSLECAVTPVTILVAPAPRRYNRLSADAKQTLKDAAGRGVKLAL